jgi:hypothetical protein
MARRSLWKTSASMLITSVLSGAACLAAPETTNTPPATPAPWLPRYNVVGISDNHASNSPTFQTSGEAASPAGFGFYSSLNPGFQFSGDITGDFTDQSSLSVVGINNRSQIVFASGDVYQWNGGGQSFEYRAFGGIVPSHLEYTPGKRPNERNGRVVPDGYEALTAVGINDSGAIIGTSRYGLILYQPSLNGPGDAEVLIPNQNPQSLSPKTHGWFMGGMNNQHQIVGGLNVIKAEEPGRFDHFFLFGQRGVFADFESRLNTLSNAAATGANFNLTAFSPTTLQPFYPSDYPLVDGVGFAPSGINDSSRIVGTATPFHPKQAAPVTDEAFDGIPLLRVIPFAKETLFGKSTDTDTLILDPDSKPVPPRAVPVFSQAAYWDGKLKVLPMDITSSYGSALGVNNRGDIVGVETGYPHGNSNKQEAVFWKDGVRYDLNLCIPPNSGWHLTKAVGINDIGEIVGEGEYQGTKVSFLLLPAPSAQPEAVGTATASFATGSETGATK